MKFSCRMRRVL